MRLILASFVSISLCASGYQSAFAQGMNMGGNPFNELQTQIDNANDWLYTLDSSSNGVDEVAREYGLDINWQMTRFADRLTTCGEQVVWGCASATNGQGTVWNKLVYSMTADIVVIRYVAPGGGMGGLGNVIAMPTEPRPQTSIDRFRDLWLGGNANANSGRRNSGILLDSCDSPTTWYADEPLPGPNFVATVRVNGGDFYRIFSNPARPGGGLLGEVDVTGSTLYLVNRQEPGNFTDICTQVSDRTGIRYTYTTVFVTNLLQHEVAPWVWQ